MAKPTNTMADLNVQPKSKSSWWLWLILILVAGVIVYFLLHKDDHRTSDKIVTDSTTVIHDTTKVTTDTSVVKP